MYVFLYLTEKETTRPAPARTISDVLMGYSLELLLPDPAKPLEGRALRKVVRGLQMLQSGPKNRDFFMFCIVDLYTVLPFCIAH